MKIVYPSSFFLALTMIIGTGFFGAVQSINAQEKDSKKIVKYDDDDKYESPKMQKKLAKEAKISKEAAERTALARVPGTVVESELDKEKGKVVWEFEIKTAEGKVFDVSVDAKTGEIIDVEDETDNDNDNDDDDDDGDTANGLAKKNDHGKWYKFWKKIPVLKKL